jgi:hypothetical protein
MAAVGSYSSLQLIAGAAILGNVSGPAFRSNAAVGPLLKQYGIVIAPVSIKWDLTKPSIGNAVAGNRITEDTANAIVRAVAGNSYVSVFLGTLSSDYGGKGFETIEGKWATLYAKTDQALRLSNVENRLDPVYSAIDGYVVEQNQQIFSAVNASDASANATYQNQNNVSTGGLSQITLAPQLFAQDIVNLGTAIDLDNLTNLGSPEALLKQIALVSRVSAPLYNALVLNGIPQNTVDTILASNLSDREQRIVYRVMEQITGSVLTEILGILNVRTEKLETLADLLNPVKAFPKSYTTLTAPTVNGLRGIYIGTKTNINSNLETTLPQYVLKPLDGLLNSKNTYASLKKIIPPDQALAWKALQAGLESVTSIQDTIFALFGASTPQVETMKGLTLVENLTQPLPSGVISYFTTTGIGSGPYNSYTVGDGLGVIAAAGAEELEEAIPLLDEMIKGGAVAPLIGNTAPNSPSYGGGLFSTLSNILLGTYGGLGNTLVIVPSGQYGAGTYANISEAIDVGMLMSLNGISNAITDLQYAGGPRLTKAVRLMGSLQKQIANQEKIMNAAGVSFANIANIANVPAQSTFNQLPQYALDTTRWNSAWFFQQIAYNAYANCPTDVFGTVVKCGTTLGGQAVIGTMRESRNNDRLATAALLTNITVSDANPQPEPAKLGNSQYSATEAANLKMY